MLVWQDMPCMKDPPRESITEKHQYELELKRLIEVRRPQTLYKASLLTRPPSGTAAKTRR